MAVNETAVEIAFDAYNQLSQEDVTAFLEAVIDDLDADGLLVPALQEMKADSWNSLHRIVKGVGEGSI